MITKKQGEMIARKYNSICVSRKCYLSAITELKEAIEKNDKVAIGVSKARARMWIDAEVEAMNILIAMGIPVISYAETLEIQKSYI